MQGSGPMTINVNSMGMALDPGDLARLRRMKLAATGFLALAAATYAATFVASAGGHGWLGFLRAGAEAAMVGGLADWFAVTALFRRPLHLPIPHTAIIPEKKDEIAAKLGSFVTSNFLTPELVARHLDEAHVVARVGTWIQVPANADTVGVELSRAAAAALDVLREDTVFDLVLDLARRDIARRSYAPMLGEVLGRVVDLEAQWSLVELAAARASEYIRDNRISLRPQIKEFLEEQHFMVWLLITDNRTDRLIDAAIRELDGIATDPRHPFRRRLDDLLRTFARDLQGNPATAARVDLAWRRLLEDEQFHAPVRMFVAGAVDSFREALRDRESGLAAWASLLIQDIGERIEHDPEFEAMLEAGLLRAVVHAAREYGDELTVLIRRTVGGWDPTSASRRIEVAVGRDLQFIRINGTVVGALAGLAIHGVTVAL
jgi:uncharacterized membrane-anchored protein YjiN (DUF445 family)